MTEEFDQVKRIVVVGGGTAGWLVAARLAAHYELSSETLTLTLVESDQTGPIGVGEGTLPSMRTTLNKIGITETEFVRECGASFKQGSKFIGWSRGAEDYYYHPFSLPQDHAEENAWWSWQNLANNEPFADSVSPQPAVCDRDLAPKQISMPNYAYALNYGYHLDAGRFAGLLMRHAVERLGVCHIKDHLIGVESDSDGDIAAVIGKNYGRIEGDLFIDCSGFESLLIGKHFEIGKVDCSKYLFNDRALAVQVPYATELDSISSVTLGTAHDAGWTWDIGLQHRRGVGRVYSSSHQSDEQALEGLKSYLKREAPHVDFESSSPRKLSFESGYRSKFWHRNCVAIGLSAGFVEPLEASALVLVELSAQFLTDQLPAYRSGMDAVADRFNRQFTYRWTEIIRFLKLHYAISSRDDSAYWRQHKESDSIPESLRSDLARWNYQAPWHHDEGRIDDLFPSASYQYVLYGMGFQTRDPVLRSRSHARRLTQYRERQLRTQQAQARFCEHLPTNRELVRQLQSQSFSSVPHSAVERL